ncbi:lactonase family protein [Vibrio sp. S9_S30]|uniref:lactonase family protein n=1 Tax=Vibrio sp. S9_S30 TaxID=2720226 RepID=UPI0016817C16|nr:lactonase family protein [Vibrio sp. S9_S30]MBD1558946.1 lactonase family protein [Vibrio sp. S9_S30]
MELYIGSYSSPLEGVEANGKGLYKVSFDPKTGQFGQAHLHLKCDNPTALAVSSDGQNLYTVREVFQQKHPAMIHLHSDAPHREWNVQGELPCHIALHDNPNWITTAQYWTGEISLFQYSEQGNAQLIRHLEHHGTGPNTNRQEGPHAHYSTFTNGGYHLHSTDLGADTIWSYELDDSGQILNSASCDVPSGCGPRHMVVSPDERFAYVCCELDETLLVLTRSGLGWHFHSQLHAFDCDKETEGSVSAIRLSPNGRHLYVSGRRQSRIAHFTIDAHTQLPTRDGTFETGGECPRDFILTHDGQWLLIGNQYSNQVVSMRLNQETGKPSPPSGKVDIGTPVAIIEIPNS